MLGVELLELWRVGRVRMPALAETYARAARDLRAVPHDDAEWVSLRWQLVGVLAAAAGQVEEAAEAVCVAVVRYAEADAGAGREFRRLRDAGGVLRG
ncbi:hypothetical protein ACQP2P_12710 [Dactylosporangium sp. CA-139114]|uniref:hypothetical protein n=1 Tax=Dactylosporangium sp. CA-139114 TaxID=3239931 RepID=UPI003D95FB80